MIPLRKANLTLGLEYKKTKLSDINKYFEAKIATIYRDKNEDFIPTSSGINNKNTNFLGLYQIIFLILVQYLMTSSLITI